MAEPAADAEVLDGFVSLEDYLRMEMESPTKHEYVAGEIHAMVRVSKRHNQIMLNFARRLSDAAGDGPCRIYLAEVKLRAAEDVIYHPDVVVACAEEGSDPYIVDRPCVVVEITSPSTASIDRREKMFVYRRIPSLEMYLIVDQEQRLVDRYAREGDQWIHGMHTANSGATIPIPCLATNITLDEIYARV
jgi:Uma2 family endonuclease